MNMGAIFFSHEIKNIKQIWGGNVYFWKQDQLKFNVLYGHQSGVEAHEI
jgi:hypothetical protein